MKRSRWVVLGIYAWVAGLSQMLWLNFAPILSFIQKRYDVSANMASLLLLVFPLTYIVLSIPAGSLTDRKGYKYAIGLGTVLMAVFSCVRVFTGSFWILLLAQTGISLGQPYVVNGITKLVMDWFPAEQATLATGLGTVGLFFGMSLGMAATPIAMDAFGFSATMAIFAAISVVSCAAFLLLCRERSTGGETAGISREFWPRMRNPSLVLLCGISFIGLGFFNGLTTWIEAILATNGIGSVQAGIIGGLLIIGGVFGSALIPALSERFRKRKPFLIASILIAAATLFPFCRSANYHALLAWSFLNGFFFLPAYALILDMTSLEAGQRWAGSATGVLMLAGNAGGVIVIVAMGWLKGDSVSFPSALPFLLTLLGAAALASIFTREPLGSLKIQA